MIIKGQRTKWKRQKALTDTCPKKIYKCTKSTGEDSQATLSINWEM